MGKSGNMQFFETWELLFDGSRWFSFTKNNQLVVHLPYLD